jgi:hypothetical protein
MMFTCISSKLKAIVIGLGLGFATGLATANADQATVGSVDNGDRLLVPYHWKIEHRAKSPIDNLVHQLGTPEGRKILASMAGLVGIDPTVASIVTANIPLPHLDAAATGNRGIIYAPSGMVICKAAPIGSLETSHATWGASILRNDNENGLGYYTSVGTSPGTTHRIEGSFYVEYVKPVDGWEQKFNCMKTGETVWNQHGS